VIAIVRTLRLLLLAALAVPALVACSVQPEADPEPPPSDPLDQMLISFNGNPSKTEIKQAMDDALNATDTAISDENYSRAGSVLVTFRKEYGIDEMDVLECVPTATRDPRVPELSFPNVAAVCVTDLVSGR
jgi:hypothetical protein